MARGEKSRAMIGKSKWEKEAMAKVYARGGSVEQATAYAAGAVGGGTYTVGEGDSWFSIAEDMFKNQRYFEAIMAANPGINMLHPGQVIKLPGIPTDAQGNLVSPTVSYDSMALSFAQDAKYGYKNDPNDVIAFTEQVASDPTLSRQQKDNLIGYTSYYYPDLDLPSVAEGAGVTGGRPATTAIDDGDFDPTNPEDRAALAGTPAERAATQATTGPLVGGEYPTTGTYAAPSRAGVFGPEVASTVADVGALGVPPPPPPPGHAPMSYGASQSVMNPNVTGTGPASVVLAGNTYGSSQGFIAQSVNTPPSQPLEKQGMFAPQGEGTTLLGALGRAGERVMSDISGAVGGIFSSGVGQTRGTAASAPATAAASAPATAEEEVAYTGPAYVDWLATVEGNSADGFRPTQPIALAALLEEFGTNPNQLMFIDAKMRAAGMKLNPQTGIYELDPAKLPSSTGSSYVPEPAPGYRPRIYRDPNIFRYSGAGRRSGGYRTGGGGVRGGPDSGGASRSYGQVGNALYDFRVGFG